MPKSIKDLNCCEHTYKVLLLLSNLLRVCVFWVGHLYSLELQITERMDSVTRIRACTQHAHTHTHIRMRIHTRTHARAHTHTHTHKHTGTQTHTNTQVVCLLSSFPVRQNKRIVSQCAEKWCQKQRHRVHCKSLLALVSACMPTCF